MDQTDHRQRNPHQSQPHPNFQPLKQPVQRLDRPQAVAVEDFELPASGPHTGDDQVDITAVAEAETPASGPVTDDNQAISTVAVEATPTPGPDTGDPAGPIPELPASGPIADDRTPLLDGRLTNPDLADAVAAPARPSPPPKPWDINIGGTRGGTD